MTRWCGEQNTTKSGREEKSSNTPIHHTQRTMEAPPKPNTAATAAATLDFGSALVFVPDHDEQEDIYEG